MVIQLKKHNILFKFGIYNLKYLMTLASSLFSKCGTMQLGLYSLHCAMCNLHYLVRLLQFVMGSSDGGHSVTAGQCKKMHIKVCSVECAVFSINCVVCSVQCECEVGNSLGSFHIHTPSFLLLFLTLV